MTVSLASILRRIMRGDRHAESEPVAAAPTSAESPEEERLRDRAIAETLDRAMHMGLWEHAARVARSARRIYPKSARLTELLVRLAMLEGAPERGLQLIDAARPDGPRNTALRLLRAGCLVQMGQKHRAHVDLLRWAREATAPVETGLMLALLEWDGKDPYAANVALLRNLRKVEDPRTIETLTLIAVAQADTAKAREWADRLANATAFGAGSVYTRLLLCSVQLPPPRSAAQAGAAQIERLAREIITVEEVVPALVEAQRLRPDVEVCHLLTQSIARALPDLARPAEAFEALTRLELIRGDHAAARRWAERGLAANPLSAPLTIMYRALSDEVESPIVTPEERTTPDDVLATIGRNDRENEPRGRAA